MRFSPLLAQSAFIALAAFGFWEIIVSSGHPTKGTGLAKLAAPICSPSQPGNFSAPQPHAPGGIKLVWFGNKGGVGCKLVNVFQTALSPHHGHASPSTPPIRTFMLSFLATLPSLITILHLSSFHRSTPTLFPTIFEILYQLFSAGAIIPLFASLGVWSRPARSGGPGRKLRSLEVEGLSFGLLVGAAYPSWKIAFDPNQNWTMAWQFFPVGVWVLQKVYVVSGKVIRGRREVEEGRSPKNALRLLYFFSAGSSLLAHLPILSLARSSPASFFQTLSSIYLPSSIVPTPLSTAAEGIHRLLQYDLIVAYVAMIAILAYRLRQPLLESASFVMMAAQATLLGGPGFALMGAWWWVEERGWSET